MGEYYCFAAAGEPDDISELKNKSGSDNNDLKNKYINKILMK